MHIRSSTLNTAERHVGRIEALQKRRPPNMLLRGVPDGPIEDALRVYFYCKDCRRIEIMWNMNQRDWNKTTVFWNMSMRDRASQWHYGKKCTSGFISDAKCPLRTYLGWSQVVLSLSLPVLRYRQLKNRHKWL